MGLVFLQGHFQPNHHLNNRCWVITYVKRVPVTGVQLKSGSEWRQKALCLIKRRHFMFDIIQRTIEMYIFGDSQEGAITFYCCKCAFFKLLILAFGGNEKLCPLCWSFTLVVESGNKSPLRESVYKNMQHEHKKRPTLQQVYNSKFNWAVKLYNHHHQ